MKPQQCPLAVILATWGVYLGGATYLVVSGRLPGAGVWAVTYPLFIALYVRVFPRLSRALGYGDVADAPAQGPPGTAREVVMYTAAGCPFCPILQRRLEALGAEWGFRVRVVDLTLNPGGARGRRIGAVPAVEVDGRVHVGNLTTAQLAELIRGAPATAPEPVPV